MQPANGRQLFTGPVDAGRDIIFELIRQADIAKPFFGLNLCFQESILICYGYKIYFLYLLLFSKYGTHRQAVVERR
jgi:hypothetical protein